ncbi:hypothetical protein [Tahibacter soli]|uniref:YD repeat-containing protein n=1 Tax=Tahibacter soli TaxID=2983605 RepID=A0A9X4BHT0_9GAMM|nr:hypothetical protein [Tahibacter soli]MDC8013241.1 hypothetical protein [Tahibacter soli]
MNVRIATLFALALFPFWSLAQPGGTPQHTVTGNVVGHGTVEPPSLVVDEGATATFAIAADPGYRLGGVDMGSCGVHDNGDGTWTTDIILGDCGITATFVLSADDVVMQGDFDADIVRADDYDVPIQNAILGTSFNWITGEHCAGTSGAPCSSDFQLRPAASFPVQTRVYLVFRFPMSTPADAYGIVTDVEGEDGVSVPLQSGDTVGPEKAYGYPTSAAGSAAWRSAAGFDGYVGFRIFNPQSGRTNYGYARLTTSGSSQPSVSGFPASIVSYAYDRRGNAVEIP